MNDYFNKLAGALQEAEAFFPTLVVDKERLQHNCEHLATVKKQGKEIRLVAKSLPSVPMLKHLMTQLGTSRLMCFHLPFLMHLAEQIPDADILIGKPMPVRNVEHFYSWLNTQQFKDFDPGRQLQWLVDSEQRLDQYEALAQTLNLTLNINLEVDVGLHRGGFSSLQNFAQCLKRLADSAVLKFSGIMGYEAHITKVPGILGGPSLAEQRAKSRYQEFVDAIETVFGDPQAFCLNTGGSTTYPLYGKQDVCNEIATASALVKPSDFDVYTLDHHRPAAFIATPVLKTVSQPELPMASGLSKILHTVRQLPSKAVFLYGGNWLANPCYPEGMRRVSYFGHSSNQEMYSIPASSRLNIDDFVFSDHPKVKLFSCSSGKLRCSNKAGFLNGGPVSTIRTLFIPSIRLHPNFIRSRD